ncbi:MAG TPA: hypothetical protein VKH37_00790 [Ferruginibacter sp.]|nr:hypothetical protein [Ferruginibacter sp.]
MNELHIIIKSELAIDLPDGISPDEFQQRLSEKINDLIKNDFERLVGYLYRIDVNENKLKSLLQQYPNEDAGKIIAALIIEREEQKIQSREKFKRKDSDIPDEEKW